MSETLFIGHKALWLTETTSTNDYLMHWLNHEHLPEGTTVAALYQTHGRGQRGTNWASGVGENLLVSVLFKPVFLKVTQQFLFSKTIALAIYDLTKFLLPDYDVKIKWPNDILVNEKKISGILIENTIQKDFIKNCIAGIGVNVNQTELSHQKATSFKLISGDEFDIKSLLRFLCSFLEKRYLALIRNEFTKIDEEYLQNLFGLNKTLIFYLNQSGQMVEAKITGVDEHGNLQLDIGNERKFFGLKEVTFL